MDMDMDKHFSTLPREERVVELHTKPYGSVRLMGTKHLKVAQMRAEGLSTREVAEALGMGYDSVLVICRSPQFKAKLREIMDKTDEEVAKIRARMVLLGDDSLDEFERVLDVGSGESISPELKVKVASKVLDCLGVRDDKKGNESPSVVVNQFMDRSGVTLEEAEKAVREELDKQTLTQKK
jgi:hypothetical protein